MPRSSVGGDREPAAPVACAIARSTIPSTVRPDAGSASRRTHALAATEAAVSSASARDATLAHPPLLDDQERQDEARGQFEGETAPRQRRPPAHAGSQRRDVQPAGAASPATRISACPVVVGRGHGASRSQARSSVRARVRRIETTLARTPSTSAISAGVSPRA